MSDTAVAGVRVAAVQWPMTAYRGFDDFAARAEQALDMAGDAEIVVFPEYLTLSLLTCIGGWESMTERAYRTVTGYTAEYTSLFRDAARARGMAILAGTHLLDSGDGLVQNVAHLFLPGGEVRRHAKTHMFGDEFTWCDAEGDDVGVVVLPSCTVGVAVCYEVEFPEVCTALAERGADVVLCPAYTFTERGFWRVRHCCHARCVENQVFAVQSCLVGEVGAPLRPGAGRSAVIGPCDRGFPDDGVIAEVGGTDLAVATATLSLDLLRDARAGGEATTRRDRARKAGEYGRWNPAAMTSLLTERG